MEVFGANMGHTSFAERGPLLRRRNAAVPVRSGGTTGPDAQRWRHSRTEAADRAGDDARYAPSTRASLPLS